ncbi:hypothetical protein FEM48_Zijuj05G0006400 [Ziziphus jujuba var. spinosa]|uniref:tRNA pseudouridine synthase n=1 Tax=Ziziphus jujuba var. spinosa TaxID=714518 RepID=A0A978VBS5_ZIZJJ|nr:hypothetical protein FEM48_Zijuj05G0006400 [Ziziphus jujuba var. spinosa]
MIKQRWWWPNQLGVGLLSNSNGNSITKIHMENFCQPPPDKVYFHYNHTDPCRFSRWTARESYQFMYARPWNQVLDFYSNLINANLSLSALFGPETYHVHNAAEIPNISETAELKSVSPENRSGRWARLTFKIVLSYHGGSFDGWQKQPGLNTVQGLVEKSLGKFVDEKKAQVLKDKCLPLEGCAVVAGRTDKGVTALQQVCSFYTWRKDIKSEDIEVAINSAAPGTLRVKSVSEVSRVFHPNFSAKWRRYLYIFPFNDGEDGQQSSPSGEDIEQFRSNESGDELNNGCGESHYESVQNLIINDNEEIDSGNKPKTFSIRRVNQLLQQLEGKLLSYKMFARDTKASRNVLAAVLFALISAVFVYFSEDSIEGRRVMCVELVANRFLRKMVRVLVATSIREAAAGAEEDALLKLMDATCRRATAPPAPADGLCLVDVGYAEFNPQNRLICN